MHLTIAWSRVGCRSYGLDPPSRRDPRRRCGGLFASDGGGRGGYARAPQGAPPRARRPEDRRAPRPHRQNHRRRSAGGIRERRRRGALRRRGATRDDRPRTRGRRRAANQVSHRHQPRRRHRRGRRHLRRRGQCRSTPGSARRARGICVSRTVRDQIRDKLPYALDDMGEQSVKNIARPVRVYALRPEAVADLPARSVQLEAPRRRLTVLVAMAAAATAALVIAVTAWWLWPTTRSLPTATVPGAPAATSIAQPLVAPRLSIVVLPFANLSNDPEQQYFADGITEDLTTDLSRLTGMFVISRNTAFTYRKKPVDTKQIGRELGVRYVLEGSVRRSGNR